MRMKCLGAKSGVKTGHNQRRADSFSRNVADGDAPSPALQFKKVVIVATEAESGLVESLATDAWDGDVAGREEGLLNVFGAFDVPANGAVIAGVGFRLLEKFERRQNEIA
jgi:hypothetical protein